MHHISGRLFESGLTDVMAGLLPHDDTPNIRCKFFIGSTAPHLRQLGDHLDQAGAQQRFAGEAHHFDAERDQDAHHAQIVGDGKLGVGGGIVAGAAVDAAVVAAVGDGDAEVGNGAVAGIAQARAGGLPGCV
jgi:hypothetical protein